PATDLKKKTLAKRPYMFVETYFSQTAMMPVNILSICGLFQLQMQLTGYPCPFLRHPARIPVLADVISQRRTAVINLHTGTAVPAVAGITRGVSMSISAASSQDTRPR
ncbi:hypothetical protein, partial [Escherichia coli]|uniref:hypothetical protein n=1 Tax=Escherichia coli TaxID=562 RepID=UPI003F4CC7C3